MALYDQEGPVFVFARLPHRAVLVVFTLLGLLALAAPARAAAPAPPPPRSLVNPGTHTADFSYGPEQGEQLTATWSSLRTGAPWLISVHGGSWITGSRANGTRSVAAFAPKGWQVFNLEYPRGLDVTVEHQVTALEGAHAWILRHAAYFHLDPLRGSAYGFSAGAQLVAQLAQRGGFRVVVSLSGVLQPQRLARDETAQDPAEPFTTGMSNLYAREKQMMGCAYEVGDSPCATRWRAFCPEFALRRHGVSWYIVHGVDDVLVPYQMSPGFAEKARAIGDPVALTVQPGYGHDDLEVYGSAARTYAMLSFVAAHSR